MTEDRDFKDVVRRRAAKTGESYQAARRQLERRIAQPSASARVDALFRTPRGVVLGCTVEVGALRTGSTVVVLHRGSPVHSGEVRSLRHFSSDVESVGEGVQCGVVLHPAYDGPLADQVVVVEA